MTADKDPLKGFSKESRHKLLRAMRDLCPKAGGGITSIRLTVPGERDEPDHVVTLTPETRKNLNARL